MKNCEVIVNFDPKDFDVLQSKISLQEASLFTDDLKILEDGENLGYKIDMLATYFGFFTKEDDSINEISIERLNILEKTLQNENPERQSLIVGLHYINLLNLIKLEKIKRILETKENILFLFGKLSFVDFAIIDLAKKMGFSTKFHVSRIQKSEIVKINIKERMNVFNFYNKFIVSNFDKNDSFNSRLLNKIKVKQNTYKSGFFLINNETDFYLKPIYPILDEINSKSEKAISFTFDKRTTLQLKQKKIKAVNLSKFYFNALKLHVKFFEILKKTEEKTLQFVENYYQKMGFGKDEIRKIGLKSKLPKKIYKIGKLCAVFLAVIYLPIKFFEIRYFFMKMSLPVFYVNHLEKYPFIRKFATNPKIKSKFFGDLTELMDDLGLEDKLLFDVPPLEMKKILDFIDDAKKFSSDDKLLEFYLNYFNQNSTIKILVKLLLTHVIITNICKQVKFDSMMIAVDSPPLNNVVCNVANINKIPTYSIPQVYIKFQKIATVLPQASKMLVSGKRVMEEFVRLGMKKERIIVTGNPRYDYVNENLNKIKLNRKDSSKKLIIVAMSRWKNDDPEWISQLVKYCNEKSLDILIKIHPMYKFSSNKYFSENLIKKIHKKCPGMNYSISYDADLTGLLPKAEIIITEYSIVAVEAAFNKTPVIVTNMNRQKDDEYSDAYINEGIALKATNQKQLFDAIELILNDEKTKQRLQESIDKFNFDYNYLNDGNASKRVCELLIKKELKFI